MAFLSSITSALVERVGEAGWQQQAVLDKAKISSCAVLLGSSLFIASEIGSRGLRFTVAMVFPVAFATFHLVHIDHFREIASYIAATDLALLMYVAVDPQGKLGPNKLLWAFACLIGTSLVALALSQPLRRRLPNWENSALTADKLSAEVATRLASGDGLDFGQPARRQPTIASEDSRLTHLSRLTPRPGPNFDPMLWKFFPELKPKDTAVNSGRNDSQPATISRSSVPMSWRENGSLSGISLNGQTSVWTSEPVSSGSIPEAL